MCASARRRSHYRTAHGACVPAHAGSAAEAAARRASQESGSAVAPCVSATATKRSRAASQSASGDWPRSSGAHSSSSPAGRGRQPAAPSCPAAQCPTLRLTSAAIPHSGSSATAQHAAQAASALPAHSAPCCKPLGRTRAVRVAQRVVAPVALAALARLPPARQAAPGALRRAFARPARTARARALRQMHLPRLSLQKHPQGTLAACLGALKHSASAGAISGRTTRFTHARHAHAAQHASGLLRQRRACAAAAPQDVPVQAGMPVCAPLHSALHPPGAPCAGGP